MKTLLCVLALALSLNAVPECYKSYAPVVGKIDSVYKKTQSKLSLKFKTNYHYEIYPTSMYPFFMVSQDTVRKLLPYDNIYLCDGNIGLNLDKFNTKHVQIAVLQYIQTASSTLPSVKTYTMHFYRCYQNSVEWVEDRPPLSVTLYLKKDSTYTSK